MSIYEEKKDTRQSIETEKPKDLYESLHNQLATLVDYDDSVIFLNDEITDHTLTDLIIRVRSLLKNREYNKRKDDINLMINSPGGDVHEMFGIIDYIESLDVKVNTICRGRAFSAAAIILAGGTGTRMMSKRSTVMMHQSSSFIGGKTSDITAYLDTVKNLEVAVYEFLESRTKKSAEWWKDKMRTDLYLSAEELIELGVIDQII